MCRRDRAERETELGLEETKFMHGLRGNEHVRLAVQRDFARDRALPLYEAAGRCLDLKQPLKYLRESVERYEFAMIELEPGRRVEREISSGTLMDVVNRKEF